MSNEDTGSDSGENGDQNRDRGEDSGRGYYPDNLAEAQVDDDPEGRDEEREDMGGDYSGIDVRTETREVDNQRDHEPDTTEQRGVPLHEYGTASLDEPTNQTEPDPEAGDTVEDDGMIPQVGFIADGIDHNEMIVLVSMSALSYAFAAWVYQGMLTEGFDAVPLQLWILFSVLIIVPLTLLFGTELATRLLGLTVGDR